MVKMSSEKVQKTDTIYTVNFRTTCGNSVSIDLCSPVTVSSVRYSPYALCRLCVTRMKIRTLEKVIMTMLLDESEYGIARARSYKELGGILCKCTHSAEAAVAALRASGLVVTARVGRIDAVVSINCDAFIRWAEYKLGEAGEPVNKPDSEDTHELYNKSASNQKRVMRVRNSNNAENTACVAFEQKEDIQQGKDSTEVSCGVLEHYNTNDNSTTLSEEEIQRIVAEDKAYAVKEYTMDDGTLYPGVYLDNNGYPHFDFNSGFMPPPCLQNVCDEDVDPSAEIAETIAAAGDTVSDPDSISFGAETDDTDIGRGVRVNPDI